MSLRIVPVTFRQACAFIDTHHRHHRPPQGMRFAVGVTHTTVLSTVLVGVATTGRPVARLLDDGATVEVTRVAADGTRNANSMLDAASWRIARAMGYHRLLTYTQAGESGASLRAAGFCPVAYLPPCAGWNRPGRRRVSDTGGITRIRWEIHASFLVAEYVDDVPTPGGATAEPRSVPSAPHERNPTSRFRPALTESDGTADHHGLPAGSPHCPQWIRGRSVARGAPVKDARLADRRYRSGKQGEDRSGRASNFAGWCPMTRRTSDGGGMVRGSPPSKIRGRREPAERTGVPRKSRVTIGRSGPEYADGR